MSQPDDENNYVKIKKNKRPREKRPRKKSIADYRKNSRRKK